MPIRNLIKTAALACGALAVTPALADGHGDHGDHGTVEVGPYTISAFELEDYSQEPTLCDELAANKDDPNRVSAGRSRSEITNLPAAIEACMEAVEAEPDNPRLNYQLGRVLGYSERGDEAMPYRIRAVEAGYPQSLFVIGFIHLMGMNIAQDTCTAAELIRLSGLRGRLAGQVGFPHYVLKGDFDACPVAKDKAEMLAMLDAAEPRSYYEELLVESLKARVEGME